MSKRPTTGPAAHLRPPIILSGLDYDRLSRLARAAGVRFPDSAADLAEELDRAHVLADGLDLANIIRMGSEVEFRDESDGSVRTVTLVYPEEADIKQGKISVLTPIGTALIGLAAGQSITWETRNGAIKRLSVVWVRDPAGS
jgi:regulator of nucleoside diphosphate kinase